MGKMVSDETTTPLALVNKHENHHKMKVLYFKLAFVSRTVILLIVTLSR